MKHNFCILLLMALYSPLLVASEFPLVPIYKGHAQSTITTTTIPRTTDMLALDLDAEIKTQYSQNAFTDFFNSLRLSEDVMIDIFNTVSPHCHYEDEVEPLTALLSEKNSFFSQSVYYFINKALENIKKATSSTIATIEDPTLPQPEHALNKLSLLLRKYVMNRAKAQIDKSYEMTLTGHTEDIYSFHIHTATGLAATSGKDKTLRIWNLHRGEQCLNVLQNDECIVYFNETGSHLATGENYTDDTNKQRSIIKQWKINDSFDLEQTHSRELDYHITHISYYDDQSLMFTCPANNGFFHIGHVKFDNNGQCIPVGHKTHILFSGPKITLEHYGPMNYGMFYQRDYKANVSNGFALLVGKYLSVTKLNCHELYLCEQAIKNTQQRRPLGNITTTNTYAQLTDYEKEMIQQQIQEKIAVLKALQPRKKHRK